MSHGGGGFMASQNDGSPSKKAPQSSPIRPMTVAQINSASQAHPDAEFLVDGMPITNISIVACVRAVTSSKSFIVYLIEDGTGQIDCRKWLGGDESEDNDDPEAAGGRLLNQYVRINGTLKSFGGKTHLHCATMRVIEDHNEILYHAVDTVSVHLRLIRGEIQAGGARQTGKGAGAANPYAAGAAAANNLAGPYDDLPALQKKIMNYIVSLGDARPDEGVNLHSIARELKVSPEKVTEECAKLSENGVLYSTTDDDHFLITE